MSAELLSPARADHDAPLTREQLAELDEAATSRQHWKTLLTAALGLSTDAYDLFIIGAALSLIKSEWHVAGCQKSLVS